MTTRFPRLVAVLSTALAISWPSAAIVQTDGLPPELSEEVATQIDELDVRIDELREQFLQCELDTLEQAIALAEQVLALREEHQSDWTDAKGNPAEWWEVGDATRALAGLQRLSLLSAHDRAELASLIGSAEQFENLKQTRRYAEALALTERQLEIRRRLLGDDHRDTLISIGHMGWVLGNQDKIAEVEPYWREVLDRRRRILGDDHPRTLISINNMGYLLQVLGRLADAEPYYREALDSRRRFLGDDDPATLISINNLGNLLSDRGKLAEAEPYHIEALEGHRRVLGDEHPRTLNSIHNMGGLRFDQGRLAEAEPYFREALERRRRFLGDTDPDTLNSIYTMGLLLKAEGRLADAEPYFREALERRRSVLGDENWHTLLSISSMAGVLQDQGRLSEAEAYVREALKGQRKVLGDDHPFTLSSIHNMGVLLQARGELAEAEPYLREALEGCRAVLGNQNPRTLTKLNNMGKLLQAQGRLAEAEPYFREALDGCRSVLGEDHRYTVQSISNMGYLRQSQGRLAEAEPYFREALLVAERLRTAVIGQERERAAYAAQLGIPTLATRYASVLIRLDRSGEAFAVAERGRGRALLDLLERASVDLIDQARLRATDEDSSALESALAGETNARAAVAEAEARVATLRKERDVHAAREDLGDDERAEVVASFERQIEEQLQRVAIARRETFEAGREVLAEFSGLVPDARPLGDQEILSALDNGELILSYAWTRDTVLVMTAGVGVIDGVIVAQGKDDVDALTSAISQLRETISQRPKDALAEVATRELLASLIPDEVRNRVAGAERLVVVADGPLYGIPFDLLLEEDPTLAGTSVVYAGSATIYVNRKQVAIELDRSGTPAALVVGNPVFDRDARPQPDYPDAGLLLAMVQKGSNAGVAGLRRGDVLLSYAGAEIADYDALRTQIGRVNAEVAAGERAADERFPISFWREGERHETALAPGRMGIRPDDRPPAEGLRAMDRAERGFEHAHAEASALDQVRLHGGRLAPLPGTAVEARNVAHTIESVGGQVELLLGEDATVNNVAVLAEGRRYVHLATHALTGSADRPYEASLAFTQPQEVTAGDIGFLRLDDLIRSWRGKLKQCDLVVLSACDTQRGVKVGDSVMALPWGFFYAGAPTVIASLWKVDDTATALLMGRFYENLLGTTPMSKADALDEAKRWLRRLSRDDVERLSGGLAMAERGQFGRRPATAAVAETGRPFAHPFYWAAFVLIGSPE